TLKQYREILLASNDFQQLEILSVTCANLQHHARRVSRPIKRLANLFNMRFMSDFHGNHLDAIFPGQLENIRQAGFAMSLKRIWAGTRFISAHARAYLPVVAQRL